MHLTVQYTLAESDRYGAPTIAETTITIAAADIDANTINDMGLTGADRMAKQLDRLALNRSVPVSVPAIPDAVRPLVSLGITTPEFDPNDNPEGFTYPNQEAVDTEQAARLKAAVEAKEGK